MSEVATLFAERSRVQALAAEMRCPAQTVYSWKRNDDIPAWRKPAVLDAVRRLEWALPAEVFAYLARAE